MICETEGCRIMCPSCGYEGLIETCEDDFIYCPDCDFLLNERAEDRGNEDRRYVR